MKIDSYLNKRFVISGKMYHIERISGGLSGVDGYIICDREDAHIANIDQLDNEGFRWFSYLLNSPLIEGRIKYADIEKNLIVN
jgi:hypothetical protein